MLWPIYPKSLIIITVENLRPVKLPYSDSHSQSGTERYEWGDRSGISFLVNRAFHLHVGKRGEAAYFPAARKPSTSDDQAGAIREVVACQEHSGERAVSSNGE